MVSVDCLSDEVATLYIFTVRFEWTGCGAVGREPTPLDCRPAREAVA